MLLQILLEAKMKVILLPTSMGLKMPEENLRKKKVRREKVAKTA